MPLNHPESTSSPALFPPQTTGLLIASDLGSAPRLHGPYPLRLSPVRRGEAEAQEGNALSTQVQLGADPRPGLPSLGPPGGPRQPPQRKRDRRTEAQRGGSSGISGPQAERAPGAGWALTWGSAASKAEHSDPAPASATSPSGPWAWIPWTLLTHLCLRSMRTNSMPLAGLGFSQPRSQGAKRRLSGSESQSAASPQVRSGPRGPGGIESPSGWSLACKCGL